MIDDCFAASYAEARGKFLDAAHSAGLEVVSHAHPLRGRDGELLAMDVARDGAEDAEALLILSSACHGVEGFCGSGVQVHALRDAGWRDASRGSGVAVLYIHALNPHGFSHLRRVTHENVDLNRNFHDFTQPLPVNAAYRELHSLLLPASWPPDEANRAAIAEYIATHGMAKYQSAVSQGQHEYPDGLFYGGVAPTWSNQTLRRILGEHGRSARRIGWIDVHTGLGPSGYGERIYAGPNDASAIERARRWWSNDGRTPVTSIYDGSSSSAYLTGLIWASVHEECPQAEYTGIALEYGTEPLTQVLDALRGDHWLANHPDAPPALAARIKADMLAAFYTDTPEWRRAIIAQAQEALAQAVAGLGTG
ncbi:MAG: M14 family metallopeptidase [Casimicrobiaceae bacterium]